MRSLRLLALLPLLSSLAAVGCASPGDSEAEGDTASDITASFTPPPAYAEGKLHSDLTPEVIANLKSIHAQSHGDDHAFIKVGDSITFSTSFLDCFGTTSLSGPQAELEETRTFFHGSSWSRQSLASTVGWHTSSPLQGNPTFLAKEIAAMKPAFAVVMLGTNDEYAGVEATYEHQLTTLIKTIAAEGIVPIMSTIPPIRNATQNAIVPKMNLVVRKVASTLQIPLMDFHATLEDLPSYGLGGDGIHPSQAASACTFDDASMKHGYNQRNLLTITALDEVRKAVLGATPADEPTTDEAPVDDDAPPDETQQ